MGESTPAVVFSNAGKSTVAILFNVPMVAVTSASPPAEPANPPLSPDSDELNPTARIT